MISGDFINRKELLNIMRVSFKSLLASVINFIPLGFNEDYTIQGPKTFNVRPKISQNTYSTRSGAVIDLASGDNTQADIGAAYLGAPYTLELGEALGLSTYSNSLLGNIEQPFIKSEPLLAYEPTTDLIGGGVPFHGNTPFVWRGFLAYSNFLHDSNVRAYVSESGDSFTIKAKDLSILIRPQSTAAFTIGTDSMSSAVDRTNLEFITLHNINITKTVTDLSLSTKGDYLIWLIYDKTNNLSNLIAVKWDTDLTTVNGIVNKPYPNYYTDYPSYRYTRPLYVAYFDGVKLIVSTQQAWGEPSTTSNANKGYGKIYQQVSSPDPIIREQTRSDDRRLIPSYYYMDLKNNAIISKTVYSGLVRHVPGAGGNRVKMQYQSGDYTGQRQLKIDIGQIELTDGTTSIWIKDLDIPALSFTGLGIYATIPNLDGSLTTNAGYIWLCADPRSILDPVDGPKNNLRLKLFISTSPTWNPDWDSAIIKDSSQRFGNTGVGSTYSTYTHRCRIGWLYHNYNSVTTDSNGGYRMHNGRYTVDTDLLGRTYIGLPSHSGFAGGYTVGTGVSANYSTVNNSPLGNIHFLPYFGSTGTSLACTEVRAALYLDTGTAISMGTAPYIALSTTKDRFNNFLEGAGTSGTRPNTLLTSASQDPCCLSYSLRSTDAPGSLTEGLLYSNMVLPIDVDGVTKIMYAGTGGDTTGVTRRAVILGWDLPIGAY